MERGRRRWRGGGERRWRKEMEKGDGERRWRKEMEKGDGKVGRCKQGTYARFLISAGFGFPAGGFFLSETNFGCSTSICIYKTKKKSRTREGEEEGIDTD